MIAKMEYMYLIDIIRCKNMSNYSLNKIKKKDFFKYFVIGL